VQDGAAPDAARRRDPAGVAGKTGAGKIEVVSPLPADVAEALGALHSA
jgi:hypothetical protein